MNTKSFFSTVLCILLASCAWAMRGGEIRWTAVDLYTYQFELHYYEMALWNRPEIGLDLGDGTQVVVPRTSVDTLDWPCGLVTRNIYRHEHTYAAQGSYVLSMTLANRVGNIINIPNSVGQWFCVTAQLVIADPLGPNNSVEFTTPMTITERVINVLHHDPGTNESDGDSLSFALVPALGMGCVAMLGYSFPHSVPGITGVGQLDEETGAYRWDHPQAPGLYNLVLEASEWRGGQLIGQVRRDMVLCVTPDYLTSVPEELEAPPITIHPNPGTTAFQLTGLGAQVAQLRLLDMQGRVVLEANSVMDQRPVDTTGIPAGVYLVELTTAKGPQVLRWVKE
jgi:hypothetical protein